ncbi:MAG: carboxylating nicotinate-nucleotide diphosphorylase [Candidatus Cloacimonetes bacterium]|jgi:nicotinate-nucleotide pyrophosphorylase (carboxylating)|nr:carboxylating nicotinate-nucleotide diphosphorylase [Candidatus Cloacimonadota bacterium]MBT6993460.1 carboxylating nicotinate-nucleotide diphosphorylase [Candidatus Cloacimonadota bacterium]MBT7469546.1 carboxylating nicotinate-nucleotide diphosphorylase [Candidatus Cloacimonadota bacterium]
MNNDFDILIKKAFAEDFGDIGDVTSSAIFSNEKDDYYLLSKDEGTLCGIDFFKKVFLKLDEDIELKLFKKDGEKIKNGEIIATIFGKVKSVLKAERTALNLLSHLSGIASETAKFVQKTNGKTKILDTRKTLPTLRKLQKYAVKCGGGENHRMGLFDLAMIKDNHIDAAGGIENAVRKVREKWNGKIEVETRNLAEVKIALNCGVGRIMLDNMDNKLLQKAVKIIGGKAETEASGNMNLERIAAVSKTGVDYISVGELTHSVTAFDFSLKRGKK